MDWLDAVEERLGNASNGPYIIDKKTTPHDTVYQVRTKAETDPDEFHVVFTCNNHMAVDLNAKSQASLYAHAQSDIAALVREVKLLKEACRLYKDGFERDKKYIKRLQDQLELISEKFRALHPDEFV